MYQKFLFRRRSRATDLFWFAFIQLKLNTFVCCLQLIREQFSSQINGGLKSIGVFVSACLGLNKERILEIGYFVES